MTRESSIGQSDDHVRSPSIRTSSRSLRRSGEQLVNDEEMECQSNQIRPSRNQSVRLPTRQHHDRVENEEFGKIIRLSSEQSDFHQLGDVEVDDGNSMTCSCHPEDLEPTADRGIILPSPNSEVQFRGMGQSTTPCQRHGNVDEVCSIPRLEFSVNRGPQFRRRRLPTSVPRPESADVRGRRLLPSVPTMIYSSDCRKHSACAEARKDNVPTPDCCDNRQKEYVYSRLSHLDIDDGDEAESVVTDRYRRPDRVDRSEMLVDRSHSNLQHLDSALDGDVRHAITDSDHHCCDEHRAVTVREPRSVSRLQSPNQVRRCPDVSADDE